MSGIVGIISKISLEKNKNDLKKMVNAMLHESFYKSKEYINEQLGVNVGLVYHKDSFSSCMPICNENNDLILLYSGENFVDKEVAEQLKVKGHQFKDYDASYLIHLYEDNKKDFFENLNGWFSGVLIDLKNKKIILFNDRFGMQRVFYHENDKYFYFASEAKSLLKICPHLRNIDLKSLGEQFCCNCVLENRTLFHNVFLLPGGSKWTFHNGKITKKEFYFKPKLWESQKIINTKEFYKKFKKTLKKILPRYFNDNHKIAMSLTGGLDSRMILANIDISPGELPFYTFGGMYRDCYDVKVARKIAKYYKQSLQVLELGHEYILNFPNIAEKTIYISDGCLDVCGSHNIYLNKLAREIAPVRLTGTFGSELLRGVTGFGLTMPDQNIFQKDFRKYLQGAIDTFLLNKNGHAMTNTMFRETPWLKKNALMMEQSQIIYRAPFMDNELVKLIYQAPIDILKNRDISLRLIKDGNPELFGIKTDRGFGGYNSKIWSSIEQLYYYALFKLEWYYNTATPNWMIKLENALKPLKPEKVIIGRNKIEHHRKWLQNELSEYVREILLDKKTMGRPLYNKRFLEKIVKDHIGGKGNYFNEINKILSIELTFRLLIENT